jgi:hypothetical protein
MSRFALDHLFMHGHIVSPAALVASGLLAEPPPGKPEPATAKAKDEPAKRREPRPHGQLAHA